MTDLEHKILVELQTRRGPAEAITAAALARLVDAPERVVRQAIHELRVAHDYGEILSGTGHNGLGFYWAESVEQIEQARHETASRMDELGKLMSAFWHARERMLCPPAEQKSLL